MGLAQKKINPNQDPNDMGDGPSMEVVQSSSDHKKGIIQKNRWPTSHPQVVHFCEMLVHRYLTEGERIWMMLSDGSDADKRLQVAVSDIVQVLSGQLFERIAIVNLDPSPNDCLDKLLPNSPFDIRRLSFNQLEDLNEEDRLARVGYWQLGEEVKKGAKAVVDARETYAQLLQSYDFILVLSSSFGADQGGYTDPLRLQAVRNIDRIYWVVEMGQSRGKDIVKQVELVKFLDLGVGEALVLESDWLIHGYGRISGKGGKAVMNEFDWFNFEFDLISKTWKRISDKQVKLRKQFTDKFSNRWDKF